MKKLLLLASGLALAAVAAPAFAVAPNSVTGTVNVTGSVAAQCSATGFSDTIALGELAKQSTGALDTTLPNNTGLTKHFSVVCSSAKPTVDVSATRLKNTADSTDSVNGYTSYVDYTATATASLAAGGSTDVPYTTAKVLPVATSTQLSGQLANPSSATNLDVTLSAAHTTVATDVLTAGSYTATITVVVEPTA